MEFLRRHQEKWRSEKASCCNGAGQSNITPWRKIGLEGNLYAELKVALKGVASVGDQSHGRAIIGISGPKARALLSKGSPVDFHSREFPLHAVAVTQMAHVGVHVSRWGEHMFELSLFRGFSENFWEWLTEQAEEFGYITV